MHFTLLLAGYFCLPINILEICSGRGLSWLKHFDVFRSSLKMY